MRAQLFVILLLLGMTLPAFAGTIVTGVWTVDDSPLVLMDNATVPAGESLTIEAGVEVVFHDGFGLRVYGSLDVLGTAKDPVIFRGLNESEPWSGISITNPDHGENSSFKYTNIMGARIGISASDAVVQMDSCQVKSDFYAVLVENDSYCEIRGSHLSVTSLVYEAKTVFVTDSYLDIQTSTVMLDIPFYTSSSAGGALHFFYSEGVVDSCHVSASSRTGADGIKLQYCLNNVSISRTAIHVSRSGGLVDRSSSGIYASQTLLRPLDHVTIHVDIDGGTVYGLYATQGSDIEARNSIIAATNTTYPSARYAAYVNSSSIHSSIDFEYMCVYDMHMSNDTPDFTLLDGTILELDPLWEDPAQEHYQLTADSPCINAGSPYSQRDPDNTRPDLGAYYFHLSGVESPSSERVSTFTLTPAWPNPFNASTQFSVELVEPSQVTVVVHNVLGQAVAVLANDQFSAGSHRITWNTENSGQFSSGTYFVRAQTGQHVATQRVVLLK